MNCLTILVVVSATMTNTKTYTIIYSFLPIVDLYIAFASVPVKSIILQCFFDSHLPRCPYLCFSYGYCMLDPRYIWHYGKTANSEKPIRQQLPPLDANREKSLRTFARWRRCIWRSTTWRNYHLKDFPSEPDIIIFFILHLLHHLNCQSFYTFPVSRLTVVLLW